MKFGRVLTAMVTPFTADGAVDYAEVKRLAVHLIENGNDSILVCGTTAETPTLTHDEKINVVKATLDGLSKIQTKAQIAERRNKSVEEV